MKIVIFFYVGHSQTSAYFGVTFVHAGNLPCSLILQIPSEKMNSYYYAVDIHTYIHTYLHMYDKHVIMFLQMFCSYTKRMFSIKNSQPLDGRCGPAKMKLFSQSTIWAIKNGESCIIFLSLYNQIANFLTCFYSGQNIKSKDDFN